MAKVSEELNNEPTPNNWKKDGLSVICLMVVTFGVYYFKWIRDVIKSLAKEDSSKARDEVTNEIGNFIDFGVGGIQRVINQILTIQSGASDYNLIYKKYKNKK